jgi:TolB-like protein/Tfp pilus assembly protein PilF
MPVVARLNRGWARGTPKSGGAPNRADVTACCAASGNLGTAGEYNLETRFPSVERLKRSFFQRVGLAVCLVEEQLAFGAGSKSKSPEMTGFFQELKRRKVVRVAIAYVVASWALAQGLAQVLPVFDISNSVIRVVIVLLLIGFPAALVLAWIFDVTPSGIERTSKMEAQPARAQHRRRNIVLLAIAGIAISAAAGFFVLPRAAAHRVDKSIAVLPFENLSDDKENAYFADGIQDDLLTNLSKIGDLKVISRTSVMQYKGKTSNIREIGKALGVSNILEGSVRREGNRVRVNVQLIDATTDEHLWANDYDRDLTDVFAIQTDLAQRIAAELQAKLSPSEKERIERKPTQNDKAYLAWVQAHNLSMSVEEPAKLKKSEELYAHAIELDPNFALAMADYSILESWILHALDPAPQHREKARALAEQAIQLQPDLPEAHLAMGYSYYYGDNNYDAALKEFEIARRGLPNQSDAYLAIGAIQRRQGKWAESTANLEKAASLNPNDSWPLQNLTFNYQMLRNFDAANKTVDRALKVNPNSLGLWEIKSQLAIAEKGDFSVGEKAYAFLKSAPLSNEQKLKLTGDRADVLLLQRRYKEGLEQVESIPDDALSAYPGAAGGKYYLIGFAKKALHDEAGARGAFLKCKAAIEQQLAKSPDAADAQIQLAKVLACLGEKDAALEAAKRATELLPESKDAFGGPDITEGVAQVYTFLGDYARAIDILGGLLNRPSNVTAISLKLNPLWDPLRSDPRFQALIEKHGSKA